MVGDYCLIGAHAPVAGCPLEDEAFIATNTSIFLGARLGK